MTAGIRKAATLLASLPGPLASRLISQLSPKHAEAIRVYVDQEPVPSDQMRKRTLDEFFRLLAKDDTSETPARKLRVDAAAPQVAPFHFLAPLPPSVIVRLLQDELPQTQAAVLAQLPKHVAAESLALFAEERRTQVIRRLANMGEVSEVALAEVAAVMAKVLHRRMPVRRQQSPSSGDLLDQILASSSGPVRRILADSIRDYRGGKDSDNASST